MTKLIYVYVRVYVLCRSACRVYRNFSNNIKRSVTRGRWTQTLLKPTFFLGSSSLFGICGWLATILTVIPLTMEGL